MLQNEFLRNILLQLRMFKYGNYVHVDNESQVIVSRFCSIINHRTYAEIRNIPNFAKRTDNNAKK